LAFWVLSRFVRNEEFELGLVRVHAAILTLIGESVAVLIDASALTDTVLADAVLARDHGAIRDAMVAAIRSGLTSTITAFFTGWLSTGHDRRTGRRRGRLAGFGRRM
jgi:hypothetical protein